MTIAAEKEVEHLGETKGAANHDHDMIHELGKRLDAVWRYDQYIANAGSDRELQEFWRDIKEQEIETVNRLKQLVKKHAQNGCL